MPVIVLKLVDILRSEDLQVRERIDPAVVDEFVASHGEGAMFPPLEGVRMPDGSCRPENKNSGASVVILTSGFHRAEMYARLGIVEVEIDVVDGDWNDALERAVLSDPYPARPRTQAEKRHAVEMLLDTDKWHGQSAREIAKAVGVGHMVVVGVREEIAKRTAAWQYATGQGGSLEGKIGPSLVGSTSAPEPKQPAKVRAKDGRMMPRHRKPKKGKTTTREKKPSPTLDERFGPVPDPAPIIDATHDQQAVRDTPVGHEEFVAKVDADQAMDKEPNLKGRVSPHAATPRDEAAAERALRQWKEDYRDLGMAKMLKIWKRVMAV